MKRSLVVENKQFMLKPDNSVFKERREIFLNKLGGKAAIIPGANLVKHHADCEYPFRQDSNFWYLTGFDEPDAIALFLSHKPKGERFIMFVAPKDVISEVWHGFRWGLDGAEKVFKADKAHSTNELKDLLPSYINGSDEVIEVDLDAWKVSDRFKTGKGPYNLEISPDGKLLIGTIKSEGKTAIWNLDDKKLIGEIKNTTSVSHGIAISSDSKYAFISVEGIGGEPGIVDVINLETYELVSSVEVGKQAGGIAFWKKDI